MKRLLSRASHHLACFTTITADWSEIESDPFFPEMTFAHPSVANVNYETSGKL